MEENLKKASLSEAFLAVLSVINYAVIIISAFEKIELETPAVFMTIMGISITVQLFCAVKVFSKSHEYMEAGSMVEKLWKKHK